MIKPLLPEGHELLEQETIPFSFWSPPINPFEFQDELIENMKYYDGVGLSANQIGYQYSVFEYMKFSTTKNLSLTGGLMVFGIGMGF